MIQAQYVLAASHAADKFRLECLGVGFLGIFNAFHPLQILDLGLGKCSFIFLVAELFNQFLQTLDIFLLPAVGGFLTDQIVLFLFHETGVVAGIAANGTVFQFIDHIHRFIQKHAVMGNDDHRLLVFGQIVFQPFNRR